MNTPKELVKESPKDTWTSTLFRWFSYIFVFWIGVLIVQIIFSVQATWMFNTKTKQEDDSDTLIYKVKPDALTFHVNDVSQFQPELSVVNDVRSDRTTHDILQGKQGPAVVLVYAEWCVHCKNMMAEFETAAKTSKVPFVRVEGQYIRQTAKHIKIEGFPSIFGVDASGKLLRFASHRVSNEFLEFSKKLKTESEPTPEVPTEQLASELPILPEDSEARPKIEVLDEEPPKEPIPEDTE